MSRRFVGRLCAVLIASFSFAGCSHDELFGPGGGVTVAVTTPSGNQTGDVRIVFTLTDDEETSADITVKYSFDRLVFHTASEGASSVAISGIEVSETGTTHTFVWDSARDAGNVRMSDVVIRIHADGGNTDTSLGFDLHNGRYLVATHDTSVSEVSLYRIDVTNGDMTYLDTLSPGGSEPWDVLYTAGYFYVANRGSDDVTVLRLDEDGETLEVVEDSPFPTDGAAGKYLATDGDHLFVSNIDSETITVFNIDEDTGRLNLNAHSGIVAASCRTAAVKTGRLYVASETAGQILIYDIASSGALQASAFSPVTGGGVATPVALEILGHRLYVSNFATATVAGFNVQTDGDLSAVAGSPFTYTGTQTLQIAGTIAQDRIFLATSAVETFVGMSLDAIGVATQDVTSPHTARGPVHTVVSSGNVVVVGNASDESIEALIVSSAGELSVGDDNPVDLGDAVGRLAISD